MRVITCVHIVYPYPFIAILVTIYNQHLYGADEHHIFLKHCNLQMLILDAKTLYIYYFHQLLIAAEI